MTIRLAADDDRERWDAYVEAHPRRTPFHRWAWSETLARTLGHSNRGLMIEDDAGSLRGVLPLVEIRSAITGTRIASTPLAGYGGPLSASEEIDARLVRRACALARAAGADHLALHFPDESSVPPVSEGMRRPELHVGFRRELPADPEELIFWIPKKSRRMVRLGLKAGLQGEAIGIGDTTALGEGSALTPADSNRAHELIAATMRDLGTPAYPMAMLQGLVESDPEHWAIWALRDGDRLVAVVWVAVQGETLFPHFSGVDPSYRSVGISNALYYTLMERGIHLGARILDFGRSKVDSGPFHFKRHFGFEPHALGYRYYLIGGRMPGISPASSRFGMAIALWRRLPVGVARRLGPHLVGHFA